MQLSVNIGRGRELLKSLLSHSIPSDSSQGGGADSALTSNVALPYLG